jgi:hypothetical protein
MCAPVSSERLVCEREGGRLLQHGLGAEAEAELSSNLTLAVRKPVRNQMGACARVSARTLCKQTSE